VREEVYVELYLMEPKDLRLWTNIVVLGYSLQVSRTIYFDQRLGLKNQHVKELMENVRFSLRQAFVLNLGAHR